MAIFVDEVIEDLEEKNYVIEKQDMGDYKLLEAPVFEHQTEKAVLAEHDIWIPKSIMRVDQNGNIYLKNWFWEKTYG